VQGRVVTFSRGQALIETAIALPLFLLAMFGVIWGLQSGVLGERVQLLARYGGMVSADIDPYEQYSLYAAYNAATGSPIASPCVSPPSTLIADGAPLSAPASGTLPFWQPSGATNTATTCGYTQESSAELSAPMLLGSNRVSINTTNATPSALQPIIGGQTQRSASLTGFASPGMAAIIACYGELQSAFEHSIAPGTDPSSPTEPTPIATYDTGFLAMSGNCG